MDIGTLASATGISGGVLAAIALVCWWIKGNRSRCTLDASGLSLSARVVHGAPAAATSTPPGDKLGSTPQDLARVGP